MHIKRVFLLVVLVFSTVFVASSMSPGPENQVRTGAMPQDTTMTTSQIEAILDKIDLDSDLTYYVRLTSGDILTGPITEIFSDSTGASFRIASQIGRARVYVREIVFLGTYEAAYRHKHRTFIMPSAAPIGGDHFIGLWELAFVYAGVGIADFVSITGGRSFIPSVPGDQQVSVANIKATVYEAPNGLLAEGKQYYAVGFNGTWINAVNFIGHLYGVATFTGRRTSVSTMLFAKVTGQDVYTVSAGTLFNQFRMTYANGSVGVGLSLDSRVNHHHDMHFLAEVWNADLTRPAGTALFVGLRLNNTSTCADFGITVATGPLVIPSVSFSWTPLNL